MATDLIGLTIEERSQVTKLIGVRATPQYGTIARMYFAKPDDQSWTYTGLWGILMIIFNRDKQTYCVAMYDILVFKKRFQEEIGPSLNYIMCSEKFHTLEVEGAIMGFNFTNSESAVKLGRMILEAIPHVHHNRWGFKKREKSTVFVNKNFVGSPGILEGLKKSKRSRTSKAILKKTVHVRYCGYDPLKGFEVYNIPQEWKSVFRSAQLLKERQRGQEMADAKADDALQNVSDKLNVPIDEVVAVIKAEHRRVTRVDLQQESNLPVYLQYYKPEREEMLEDVRRGTVLRKVIPPKLLSLKSRTAGESITGFQQTPKNKKYSTSKSWSSRKKPKLPKLQVETLSSGDFQEFSRSYKNLIATKATSPTHNTTTSNYNTTTSGYVENDDERSKILRTPTHSLSHTNGRRSSPSNSKSGSANSNSSIVVTPKAKNYRSSTRRVTEFPRKTNSESPTSKSKLSEHLDQPTTKPRRSLSWTSFMLEIEGENENEFSSKSSNDEGENQLQIPDILLGKLNVPQNTSECHDSALIRTIPSMSMSHSRSSQKPQNSNSTAAISSSSNSNTNSHSRTISAPVTPTNEKITSYPHKNSLHVTHRRFQNQSINENRPSSYPIKKPSRPPPQAPKQKHHSASFSQPTSPNKSNRHQSLPTKPKLQIHSSRQSPRKLTEKRTLKFHPKPLSNSKSKPHANPNPHTHPNPKRPPPKPPSARPVGRSLPQPSAHFKLHGHKKSSSDGAAEKYVASLGLKPQLKAKSKTIVAKSPPKFHASHSVPSKPTPHLHVVKASNKPNKSPPLPPSSTTKKFAVHQHQSSSFSGQSGDNSSFSANRTKAKSPKFGTAFEVRSAKPVTARVVQMPKKRSNTSASSSSASSSSSSSSSRRPLGLAHSRSASETTSPSNKPKKAQEPPRSFPSNSVNLRPKPPTRKPHLRAKSSSVKSFNNLTLKQNFSRKQLESNPENHQTTFKSTQSQRSVSVVKLSAQARRQNSTSNLNGRGLSNGQKPSRPVPLPPTR